MARPTQIIGNGQPAVRAPGDGPHPCRPEALTAGGDGSARSDRGGSYVHKQLVIVCVCTWPTVGNCVCVYLTYTNNCQLCVYVKTTRRTQMIGNGQPEPQGTAPTLAGPGLWRDGRLRTARAPGAALRPSTSRAGRDGPPPSPARGSERIAPIIHFN